MKNILAICVLFSMSELAVADEVWTDLEDWKILINSEDVTRCYATRLFEDGSEVQIGTEPALDGGYFAIYNSAWTHIEDGMVGQVEFDFERSRFGGEAIGRIENGVPGGYAFFNNPAFVQEFARRQTVNIKGSNGTEFELDLTGTSRAIRAILACQDDQPTQGTEE